MTPIKKRKEGN